MIADVLVGILLITDLVGAGTTPAPQAALYDYPTPPEVAAAGLWQKPEDHHAPSNSSASQSDTGPRAGVWHELAVCESGWYGEPRWDYNGDSGFDGGIQFHPRTWTAFKDPSDPDYAYQASPQRQIEIGKRVAAQQGAGAWPSCTSKLGITTQQLLNN